MIQNLAHSESVFLAMRGIGSVLMGALVTAGLATGEKLLNKFRK